MKLMPEMHMPIQHEPPRSSFTTILNYYSLLDGGFRSCQIIILDYKSRVSSAGIVPKKYWDVG